MTFFNFSVSFIIASCAYVYSTFSLEDQFKVLHAISKITWQIFGPKTKQSKKNCNISIAYCNIPKTLGLENLPY